MKDTTDNWNALMLSVYEGCSPEEALVAFGIAQQRKIGRPSRPSRWDKDALTAIRRMRRAKMSWRKIGDHFGVHASVCHKVYYKKGPLYFDDWDPGNE